MDKNTAILSFLVDRVIIIIKVASTQREIVNGAIDKIKNKEKIMGLVINGNKSIPGKTKYNNAYYC